MTTSTVRKIAAACTVLGLATVAVAAAPKPANAWWYPYGYGYGGYAPPVVVAPPPAYYAPPAYYGQRAWIPGHWRYQATGSPAIGRDPVKRFISAG